MPLLLVPLLFLVVLSGCIARTAADIVTLPVKAAGAGVDAVTTSQDEADRNRGREIRRQEERAARGRRRNAPEDHRRRTNHYLSRPGDNIFQSGQRWVGKKWGRQFETQR